MSFMLGSVTEVKIWNYYFQYGSKSTVNAYKNKKGSGYRENSAEFQ